MCSPTAPTDPRLPALPSPPCLPWLASQRTSVKLLLHAAVALLFASCSCTTICACASAGAKASACGPDPTLIPHNPIPFLASSLPSSQSPCTVPLRLGPNPVSQDPSPSTAASLASLDPPLLFLLAGIAPFTAHRSPRLSPRPLYIGQRPGARTHERSLAPTISCIFSLSRSLLALSLPSVSSTSRPQQACRGPVLAQELDSEPVLDPRSPIFTTHLPQLQRSAPRAHTSASVHPPTSSLVALTWVQPQNQTLVSSLVFQPVAKPHFSCHQYCGHGCHPHLSCLLPLAIVLIRPTHLLQHTAFHIQALRPDNQSWPRPTHTRIYTTLLLCSQRSTSSDLYLIDSIILRTFPVCLPQGTILFTTSSPLPTRRRDPLRSSEPLCFTSC